MLQRKSLKDQIIDILLEKIQNGDLKPGDRLKELRLAQEFGTSQAPVREALRSLEATQIVRHIPHVGSVIKQLSISEIKEISYILEALEAHSMIDQFPSLQENILTWDKKINEYFSNRVLHIPDFYYKPFHKAIIELTGNQTLTLIWTSLSTQLEMSLNTLEMKLLDYSGPNSYMKLVEATEHGNEQETRTALKEIYQTLLNNLG